MTGTLKTVRERRERTRLQALRDDAKKLHQLIEDIDAAEVQLVAEILALNTRGFNTYWIASKLGRTPKEIQRLIRLHRPRSARTGKVVQR